MNRIKSRLGDFSFYLSLFATVFLFAGGPVHRLQGWSYETGFRVIHASVFFSGFGIFLALLHLLMVEFDVIPPIRRKAVMGLVIGVLVFGMGYSVRHLRNLVPDISDISTDFVNPLAFVASAPLRLQEAEGEAATKASSITEQQKYYPDIQSIHLDENAPLLFARVLSAIRSLGWEVLGSDATQGRIEAVSTSFWFGVKSDVIVRITSAGDGCQVDARSASRLEKNDLGSNAKQIRNLLAALKYSKTK